VLLWARDFPGRAFEVRAARRWIEGLLPDCEPREDVLLLASELCANAVVHTRSGLPGGRFSVHIEWSPERARVVIEDQGSPGSLAAGSLAAGSLEVEASPAVPAWARECGRGLPLVAEIADDWGTVRFPDGRCTWFDVRWAAQDGPPLALIAVD
jgi:anti-sigma regulatory factor (Ser/Thr protein kinase)